MRNRLFYIDNLRIFLISLVVLHHLAITYGAPGGWYYTESQAEFPEIIPMAIFTAGNQSYFMGFFFFISAFFILPSLIRKGNRRFITDRLIRLGIPLAVFYFLISPFSVFLKLRYIEHKSYTFVEVLQNGWGQSWGPLWFVEALLVFTALFLLFRKAIEKLRIPLPSTKQIIITALLVGLSQFVIRIWMPVGESMPVTKFQLPFFMQYIVLFIFGIVAWKNNWMEQIDWKTGKRWFIFSQLMLWIVFPLLFAFGGAGDGKLQAFMGGFTWQNMGYALWEQITGFAFVFSLLAWFKKSASKQGKLARQLSDSAYGVFIFHTPILVGLSALFLNWQPAQLIKFIALVPISLLISFIFAWFVKQIPGAKRVL